MPPKIREIEARLRKAVISGHEGDDTKRYQIKEVDDAIHALKPPKA